jgi:hypothetical protein
MIKNTALADSGIPTLSLAALSSIPIQSKIKINSSKYPLKY